MKKSIAYLLLFVVLMMGGKAMAQVDFGMSADMQSRYVWRGQALGGSAPCLQPAATIGWKGLALDLWGCFSLNSSEYQELDWTLSYTMLDDMIRVQVTDYACPNYTSFHHYFDYNQNTTEHVLEAGLTFNVPKTNLSASVFTNFYGADAHTADGNLVYSTYAELGYEWNCEKVGTDFAFALGCALNGKDGYSFYGNDGFDVVNISVTATRTINLSTTFSLPVYAQVMANPAADKMFLVCGTHIDF
ncbi:MAG: hypothetical protein MJZ67_07915 [Bacteroidales bacterium]|nr:hypothetical protein [Bacteroidales bacterium]